MKVFADFHHAALFHSLQLLFEDRLGYEVFRPIGLEWYQQGYWKVFDHPNTANQYLGFYEQSNVPLDVHGNPLPKSALVNLSYIYKDDIYRVRDPYHFRQHLAITLEKFKEMKFDILISSIPQHIQPFNKLIKLYQPQAKHIFQIGNCWGQQQGVNNILSSTAAYSVPSDVNIVFYHQEFDLNLFKYVLPQNPKIVNSYIHYMQNLKLMDSYASQLDGWKFNQYGAGMKDGCFPGAKGVSEAMVNSSWTWHYKPEGDGFGHTLHSSFACGRPTIIWGEFYRGKLADQLLEDQVTCIDISLHSFEDNAKLIRYYSQPENHLKMCEAAHNRFKQVVDFDKEEIEIKKFLERLL